MRIHFRSFVQLFLWSTTLVFITIMVINYTASRRIDIPNPPCISHTPIVCQRKTLPRQDFTPHKNQGTSEGDASSPCPSLKPPDPKEVLINLQKWLPLGNGSDVMFGFSAYLDVINKSTMIVRLIGMSSAYDVSAFCQLWYTDNTMKIVKGKMKKIPYTAKKLYGGIYWLCPLPTTDKPYAVSIVNTECQKSNSVFSVQHVISNRHKFTVCVSPLHHYNNTFELVEMVESNRLMGADYFVFYDFSIYANVRKILKHYADMGILELIQWKLPSASTSKVHYFAQTAQLNDCLYRNRQRTKYLVMTDMDELIVPRIHSNWSQMISSLPESNAYMFRCAIFGRDWADTNQTFSEKDLALKYNVKSILKRSRGAYIFKYFDRSKYIVKTDSATTLGIHVIWEFRKEPSLLKVDNNTALLHHYRIAEKGKFDQTQVVDNRMGFFQQKLVSRIHQMWKGINAL